MVTSGVPLVRPLLPGTAIFGTGDVPTASAPWSGTFVDPAWLREARVSSDVGPLIDAAEASARQGAWVVLVVAYEAAPAFDAAFRVAAPGAGPLAWAAAYAAPQIAPAIGDDALRAAPTSVVWTPGWDATTFAARLAAIHRHIAAGNTYQVNVTFPLHARLDPAEAWAWYAQARQRAAVPHAAWIARADDVVLSLSPELFVARERARLTMRPMKGTAARGRWREEDVERRDALAASEKARAENVMIVDLLRNDLGRLARTGSVRADGLCSVEAYPTVWQMVSTVTADVPPSTPLRAVFEALFPCGSITGAPKVRTMDIIAEQEKAARGVYTGAIGLLRPGGDALVSVPIRTALLERRTGHLTLGVGAGITADSHAADEYAECLLKAQAWQPAAPVTGLFETMRLDEGSVPLRARHLDRLAWSASVLGLPHDGAQVIAALAACAARHPAGLWRVRLVLRADGRVSADAEPHVDEPDRLWRVAFARTPVDVDQGRPWHKTLDRTRYDRVAAERPDADAVLLWTPAGRVTEATWANVVVELDGRRWTPPLADGLLPGVFRASLLADGVIGERSLTRDEVRRATRVWLINALRGWMAARIEE